MKKQLLILLVILNIIVIVGNIDGQIGAKLSIEINTAIGYDMQTRSNNYNLYGPLIIPLGAEKSILHIEKPYRYDFEILYDAGQYLDYSISFGQSTRALRYWSIDSMITDNSCRNCKIGLKVKQFDVFLGVKLNSNKHSKLNLFFKQSFGFSYGPTKSKADVGNNSAELILLKDQTIGVLVQNKSEAPTLTLKSELGCDYRLSNRFFLSLGLSFSNELTNGSTLYLRSYSLSNNEITGAYSPYDLEFKTIFSKIGIKYKFGKNE